MRFYGKLLVLVAAFGCLSSRVGRHVASELAYEMRVLAVCAWGTAADHERLVDDTHRTLASQNGRPDVYRAGRLFHELLAQRLAEANRRNAQLSEHELLRLRDECAREAFASVIADVQRPAVTVEEPDPAQKPSADDRRRYKLN